MSERPARLTRAFQTALSRVEFTEAYPYIDPDETLEAFLNHHISKGDTAYDWSEKFRGFAAYRNAKAKAARQESVSTDSMGLPLDGRQRAKIGQTTESGYGRRFLDRLQHHLSAGLPFGEARAQAISDLEGDA